MSFGKGNYFSKSYSKLKKKSLSLCFSAFLLRKQETQSFNVCKKSIIFQLLINQVGFFFFLLWNRIQLCVPGLAAVLLSQPSDHYDYRFEPPHCLSKHDSSLCCPGLAVLSTILGRWLYVPTWCPQQSCAPDKHKPLVWLETTAFSAPINILMMYLQEQTLESLAGLSKSPLAICV